MQFTAAWMELESIMLNTVSQWEKNKLLGDLTHLWSIQQQNKGIVIIKQ